jgi:hypothetical protein
MKKKLLHIIAVLPLLSFGWWMASLRGAAPPTAPLSLDEALRAHGGREAIGAITAFRAQAVRLTSTQPTTFFERRLTVAVAGAKFRRQIESPFGSRLRVEWFDGQGGFQFISVDSAERQPPAMAMNERRLQAVKSSLAFFGLLPILQRCNEPNAEIIAQDSVSERLNRFRIKTSAGEWAITTDQSHLIRQVEIGPWLLQFADYRSVGEIKLPFIQRLSVGQRLVTELVFSAIDINPAFPTGYFTAETSAREAVR